MESHMKQITSFYLEDCLLGLDSAYIQAIQPATALIKMPQKEEQLLLGMMKLTDGSFVHVINSLKLLGLSSSAGESKTIVFRAGNLQVGLIVDAPVSVLTIDEKSVAAVLPLSKIKKECFSGTVTDESGNVILLLNMEKLLSNLTVPSSF